MKNRNGISYIILKLCINKTGSQIMKLYLIISLLTKSLNQ